MYKVMDAYEFITNKIVEAMENGVNPWRMPWRISKAAGVNMPYWSRKGKGYSFLNCMLLSMQGKQGGEFITLKQANEEGGRVKKGAKSAVVVFWCRGYKRKGTDDQGNEVTEYVQYNCPVLKKYNVFSVEDCEGLKPKQATGQSGGEVEAPDPIEEGERLLAAYTTAEGAPKFDNSGSDSAYYSPTEDKIKVPALGQYDNAAEYYSTSFHECVHSTGHPSRLDRKISGAFRGSEEYAAEELVAEIGSAFLCNAAGIDDDEAFNNSAAYLKGWAKRIKEDKKLFPVAAARAEKAARYILGEREF